MLFPLSPFTYKEVECNKDSFQAAKTDSYVEGFPSGKDVRQAYWCSESDNLELRDSEVEWTI